MIKDKSVFGPADMLSVYERISRADHGQRIATFVNMQWNVHVPKGEKAEFCHGHAKIITFLSSVIY